MQNFQPIYEQAYNSRNNVFKTHTLSLQTGPNLCQLAILNHTKVLNFCNNFIELLYQYTLMLRQMKLLQDHNWIVVSIIEQQRLSLQRVLLETKLALNGVQKRFTKTQGKKISFKLNKKRKLFPKSLFNDKSHLHTHLNICTFNCIAKQQVLTK